MRMEDTSNLFALYSNPLVIKNIIKKTKAQGWKDAQVGDQIIIKFSLEKRYFGINGQVPYYEINIPERNLKFKESHNHLINRLMGFELEQYDPENRSILGLL